MYYKVIRVVSKPKLLFVSEKDSRLVKILERLYKVDTYESLSSELNRYYGIVLNDINANNLKDNDINKIDEFVTEGNGMLVIGGKNSYNLWFC